ncbi:DUF4176 domain-containing protein [Bacillus coahuilensis]|uniref:DUF4176 domain-containing protein n=1 Tax=Bacillus coahuilensis TaxID=408580 RepID=UPI0012DE7ACB
MVETKGQKRTNVTYDYIGVPYPEGNLTEDFNVCFLLQSCCAYLNDKYEKICDEAQ